MVMPFWLLASNPVSTGMVLLMVYREFLARKKNVDIEFVYDFLLLFGLN